MKIRAITCVAALAVTLCTVAHADAVKVRVNGDLVQFNGTPPMEMNGRIMVPLRGVLEKLGATVDWMPEASTVVASRGDTQINLPIGSDTATVNGREVHLDTPATVIDGHTMVPLRFVSEALGANVRWVEDTQTAMIDTGGTFNAYRMPRGNAEPGATGDVELPSGTVISARLDDRLSSEDSSPGDRFTAAVEPGPRGGDLPDGTTIDGAVREAIPAHGRRPGVLSVDFRRINLPGGETRDLDASLISLNRKYVHRTASGRLVARSGHEHDQMKWIGIGAGAGLLMSTLLGGDAVINSVLGAGAGYLYSQAHSQRPGNVVLRHGTEIGVRLNRPLRFSARR